MKSPIRSLFLTLIFFMCACWLQAQSIPLELNANLKNQMNITEDPAGTYVIQTLGLDPWILTKPLIEAYDPNQVYVISFDYIAEAGLDNLEIFYGAPLSVQRKIDFGSLTASSSYVSFKAFMKYEASGWNAFYDRFRFDFGKATAQTIKLKNLQIRAALPGEVIPLQPDLSQKNQLEIEETAPGTYNITTLEGGDPWVISQQLSTAYNPDQTFVISFEYVASQGLDDLQIFYGQPFSPERRAVLGSLEPATTPRKFAAVMKVSAPVWNSFYDSFRFDFGRAAGQNIQVSKLVLREPTNQEKKAFEIKESVAIELDVARTSANLTATEIAPGTYQLNTFANDPWIISKPLNQLYDIEKSYIITFEYKTEEGYNELEIFHGPPITGTQRFAAGALAAAPDWTTVTINPRLLTDNFQTADWTLFRFDFGRNENVENTIFVRNLQIRKPTPEELEAEKTSDKFVSQALNQQFLTYLNTAYTDSVKTVRLGLDSVWIEGVVTEVSESLFIAEIEPHQYGFDQTEFSDVRPLTIADGKFSLSVPRFVNKADHQYDRLYSRWAVVKKGSEGEYLFASHAHWANNIAAIAANNLVEEKASSIKGLDGLVPSTLGNFSDLTDLDIKSMKLNLLFNGVFSITPTSMTHEFNGKTYYINTPFVESFDARIKQLTDNDIKSAFVLLIPIGIVNEEVRRIFVHPDATLGLYSMANVATAEGAEYYAAMVDFLAERYSRPDGLYGRLDQWIIHNEVDAHTSWTHAGQKPVELYTEIYDRSMRMVHYTIRKHNPTAKVFGSFTKHWNSKAGSEANFRSKDVLEVLNSLSKREGDYEWGIGWHSYPTNLFNPKVWNDPPLRTQFNFDTPEITPKNLEMIDAYVRQKAVLYAGKKVRTILLSENGFSSNTEKNINANETTQAAALAYFWKKTHKRLPSIENIQLHRWVDNPNEAGLAFGLWTVQEGTFDGFDKKKEGWYVWDAAGTEQEDAVMDPYKAVIGISDWSEIYQQVSTEVTPYTVRISISNCSASLQDLLVSFNGEHKTPQPDGSLVFYNVASNVPQPYEVRKGNAVLTAAVLNVEQNMELAIDLKAIENLSATGIATGVIKLQWESLLTPANGFVVELKKEGESFSELVRVASDQRSYNHTGVKAGTRYYYRVAANIAENTLSCYSEEADVIAPYIVVDYKDGDKGRTANNTISPQFILRNTANHEVSLEGLSLRYWFTAEDYAPLQSYIDYAKLGQQQITARFVAVEEVRQGANYYLELSFKPGLVLEAAGNSGEIFSRIAKEDWTNFRELDDYSYAHNESFKQTRSVTLYQNGELIWGEEPAVASEQEIAIKVLHKHSSPSSDNSIRPALELDNAGNQGVDLSRVKVRYWFTPETAAPLQYAIDFSKLDASQLQAAFDPAGSLSSNYLELGFKESAGKLHAFSSSGAVNLRIYKSDWSLFDELDDHSYVPRANSLVENRKITAYIDGELVWGEEPGGLVAAAVQEGATTDELLSVYPNAAQRHTSLRWSAPIQQIGSFELLDYNGTAYPLQVHQEENDHLLIALPVIRHGLYLLKGQVNGKTITHRLAIE